jgi:tRNA-splicing endonuclease subunit Sen54
VPTLAEIGDLLDSQPDDALPREKAGSRLETRIKHGRKNVLLAVVDMGVVSYLRLSDACFGAEKLFEEKARAGSKGKRSVRPQGGGGEVGRKGQGGRVQKPENQNQNQQQKSNR